MLPLDFGEARGLDTVVRAARQLNAMPDNSVKAVREKAAAYERLRLDERDTRALYDLWTAAFFLPLTDANDPTIPTTQDILNFKQRPAAAHGQMVGRATELAQQIGFFHWELEFPDVFGDDSSGGFDVVLGNPPWERIKLQEQEHWVDVPEIRDAANKAAREKAIQGWRNGDDRQRARVALFDAAKYRAEAESRFVRASQRFPLTAVGDVNTYALFAEHARDLLAPTGRSGIIVPTGIATDDTTKEFFGDLIVQRQLVSLYDFENRENIFPGVGHGRYKFCLLTMGQSLFPTRFIFFATNTRHLEDEQRMFTLTSDEVLLINPNTRTSPTFRTLSDAELTKKIYRHVPVLVDERAKTSPWGTSFMRMFDMSNDSHLFISMPKDGDVPLYEAKMLWHFDHRYGDYADYPEGALTTALPEVPIARLQNPCYAIKSRYWVKRKEIEGRLAQVWQRAWLLAFRGIARSTDERSAIFSLLPLSGVGNSAPVALLTVSDASLISCWLMLVEWWKGSSLPV
jgi:hypothetical protein